MPEPASRVGEEEAADRGMDREWEGREGVCGFYLAWMPGQLKGINYLYDQRLRGKDITYCCLQRCDYRATDDYRALSNLERLIALVPSWCLDKPEELRNRHLATGLNSDKAT